MANFQSNLWTYTVLAGETDVKPDAKYMLLVAIGIWMRSMDHDGNCLIGLGNLLKLIVPYTNELKLGLDVPAFKSGKIVSSAGDIWECEGEGKFVYSSSNWAKELGMENCYSTQVQYTVSLKWIEWAIHWMAVEMHRIGNPWRRTEKKLVIETIGGIEKVDWL